MFKIIQKRRIFIVISGILSVISIISLIVWGLNFGTDFTGGTSMELQFNNVSRPDTTVVKESLNSTLGSIEAQSSGEDKMILKFKTIDETTHQLVLKNLKDKFTKDGGTIEEARYESIGPTVGKEMERKAFWAILFVNLGILIYISFAFRKVSKPVPSWVYAAGAIIALIHDVLITTGFFSILGHFFGVEFTFMIIVALLTILGYSVHDTIVVYDRIRENLLRAKRSDFENTVNESINQTLARSINTSLATELSLLALYFFGGDTIKYFTVALIFGIFFGTYSSIFIATAFVMEWQVWNNKK